MTKDDAPSVTPEAASRADKELSAIHAILAALTALDNEERKRVISYVFQRLGFSPAPALQPGQTLTPPTAAFSSPRTVAAATDIRSLAEQKKPRSAVEMAVLVAYYVAEVAPTDERKNEITTEDVRKYFKQANYPLPRRPRKTLFDAKNAGYLDGGSARGSYKLNPVGYNLIAHNLPAPGSDTPARPTRGRLKRKRKKG
ncbi:MAG TPA: hypothetical protein VNI83_05295 [Vicinamibacterales bacterium]|nr:hypothetical protein [Vicinamibacterales bacterium]